MKEKEELWRINGGAEFGGQTRPADSSWGRPGSHQIGSNFNFVSQMGFL